MGSEQPQRFRSIPSATGGIARLACARLHEHGKDIAPLLTKAGLTLEEANNPAIRLEVPAQIRFLDLAAEALDDDLLGFHLASGFDLREIGLLYYVIASSAQLEEALRNAVRFGRITNEGVRLQVVIEQALVIALEYMNVDRLSDKHQAEFLLAALVRLCRQVTDARLAPLRLKARHFRDSTPAEIRKFLGCDIEFSAGVDEITFPKQFAVLPVTGHDPFLNNLLRRYAEEALENQTFTRESICTEVEKVLTELLPHGRAAVSEVARKLGMSPRTLSRKLHDQHATYAEILDRFRAALARRYLAERELPVSEVAWLLGYNELSSFTHAFKRWTGLTPRQFRSSKAA
jgi:AraC-like DNA-binding protein/nucleotide-binding universal stress UspA family protein